MTTSDEREASQRLLGIEDAFTVRVTQLVAEHTRVRLSPALMDEIRHWAGVAVRGAALEGARHPSESLKGVLPTAKVGRAHARELTITTRDTPTKLPDGV